jgi:hypothetical protein
MIPRLHRAHVVVAIPATVLVPSYIGQIGTPRMEGSSNLANRDGGAYRRFHMIQDTHHSGTTAGGPGGCWRIMKGKARNMFAVSMKMLELVQHFMSWHYKPDFNQAHASPVACLLSASARWPKILYLTLRVKFDCCDYPSLNDKVYRQEHSIHLR